MGLLLTGKVQRCPREMVGERAGLMLCGPHIRFADGGRRVVFGWTKEGAASKQQLEAARTAVGEFLAAQQSKELEAGA